ncbi:MAG: hypothetical protein LC130_04145 [Bryobacterales bacterium]|nr:hypothetical protein [Bryobacterales bacterium]
MRWRLIVVFAWTLVVFVGLLVFPTYSDGSTVLAVNGAKAFVAVGIPILTSSAPLFFSHKTRMPAGVAMLVFMLIGGLSVGLLYAPSAVMLLWPQGKAIGRNE